MSRGSLQEVGFGGGCHWCTEAVFQSLRGVASVNQGFIASDPPNDSFSEAVVVAFDPLAINLSILSEIHIRTHASSSAHSMRGKYRSAIYAYDVDQQRMLQEILESLQSDFGTELVTQILIARNFKPSDERFHNYYRTDPERPFCQAYIDPKLALLRREYGSTLRESETDR